MIALRTLWRYLPGGVKETTLPGARCDWAKGGAYETLGWAVAV